ncbi:DUF2505 domain-containing protein [Mycolicibacter senuensis]|uniref:DUF2505 domain-containing protein n=1 Tax=Mycolicibacter senuensis TaxID=386913 RepID=A0A7I9XIK3_9MYCO|nr:DUF2505 domain-containing protein [Mycolicibacter senuensis]MDQ2626771.1 DUF2505 domain-containing protein [Actinomycetota bacterium]ORW66961.1 hypothetical protein AWC24_11815 [Mycolicibacter senuensis]GFG69360.1 hypothetical protein MSEN_10800 [Mycolicibacter senuensis]
MPRSFDIVFESPATVEQVQSAFGSRDYWLARIDAFEGEKTLDSLTVDTTGTVRVVVTEDLRHGALPGMLTKIYRGDLNIVTTEVWTPTGDGRVSGDIDVAVVGAPGRGGGTALLQPAGSGSRMDLTGTIEFKMPLVGGPIESFLAKEFAQGIPEIQRFTARWLTEGAGR